MKKYPFVIRVYGIYIHNSRYVLVSDEYVYGKYVTKFPGGGLEFGEGTLDCLKREMTEETGMSFDVLDHYYTTDYFVPSAFNPEIQVMSVYYLMRPSGEMTLKISNIAFDFEKEKEGGQSFRFIDLELLDADDFIFSIDRHVAQKLKSQFLNAGF
ncbi:MAG TPA: NUDIX domain-containing protein [Bacteroidia bacterium]|nr:NUDIX domain-containing protein [Bacteroidia bacterium]